MVWLSLIFVFCAVFSADAVARDFRWCTVSDDEMTKCNKFKEALPGIAKIAGVEIKTPSCVTGSNDEDCMKKIKNNEADFITLDGGKIFQAGKSFDLVPIIAEDYGGPAGLSYYAVAVARNNTDINLNNLKGKKSCHTGYRRTAGWNIPIGYLLETKMPKKGCDAQSASAFFSKSCVPGAPKLKGIENLCELCPKKSECSSDSTKNKYSGYHGAFYCMAANQGDVAFVKHLTTGEVVKEGNYGKMSDYKYLCTDGSTREVTKDSHVNCSLASNPSHAVVTRAGENQDFVNVLLKASEYCQPNITTRNCSGFLIFDSGKYVTGKKDLLFKDSTKKLVDVGDKKKYRLWLGEGYTKALEALGTHPCSVPSASPRPSRATHLNTLPAILIATMFVIGKAPF